jgi:putative flavoprotein involved in K+ transport
MSEHLSKMGISHLVLERGRIAESWRSARWDSLVANGPAWHDRFPGMEFPGVKQDEFVAKEKIADYFVDYAKMIDAPIHCGVDVKRVGRNVVGRPGFIVETSGESIEAEYVVVATGAFQQPVIPSLVPANSNITQLHSSSYRNPAQLAAGAILVVGSGSSGTQIADELLTAGRVVYLSVGAHDRPPRRYRGRDFVWWLGVLNKWDADSPPGAEHVTIAVSGAHGGKTVDFRVMAERGLTLVGRTKAYIDGVLHFESDLANSLSDGDRNYLSILDEADSYIDLNGLNLPKEPRARYIPPDPDCVRNPILRLNVDEARISTMIWATGFAADYSWLDLDVLDEKGAPRHQRGVSVVPGLYFLGLPWQSRRGSSFIWGVWHDAKFIADHIARQRRYFAYSDQANAEAAVSA